MPGTAARDYSRSTNGPLPQPTFSDRSNAYHQAVLADWQRPIEFYGKVVDETSNAIAGASVSFRWDETPFEDEGRTAATQSGADGLFSLTGALGRILGVTVTKEGYYTSRSGAQSYRYSLRDEVFSPDSAKPVVFTLRKKGQGAELLTSENGVRANVAVRVPKNGAPVRVDLLEKKASANGQLEISQNKPPWKEAREWSFRLSLPGGGLVANEDEFQFEAPGDNYQPSLEFSFMKSETNWTTQVSKQFYIAFGQPRTYGWLRIESNLAQETIFLTYAINPSGSRNLEPK